MEGERKGEGGRDKEGGRKREGGRDGGSTSSPRRCSCMREWHPW